MTTYLGKSNFEPLVKPYPGNRTRERHFAKVGKVVPYMWHLNRLYFMYWSMNFCWYLEHKSRRLLYSVHQMEIVRFLLFFKQYGIKSLITSFWDTQYVYYHSTILTSFILIKMILGIQWGVWVKDWFRFGSPGCQNHSFNMIHILFRIKQPCDFAIVSILACACKNNNNCPLQCSL